MNNETLDLTDVVFNPETDALIPPDVREANAIYDDAVCMYETRESVRLLASRLRRHCGTAVAARALLELAMRDRKRAAGRVQRIALSDLQIWVREEGVKQ